MESACMEVYSRSYSAWCIKRILKLQYEFADAMINWDT